MNQEDIARFADTNEGWLYHTYIGLARRYPSLAAKGRPAVLGTALSDRLFRLSYDHTGDFIVQTLDSRDV